MKSKYCHKCGNNLLFINDKTFYCKKCNIYNNGEDKFSIIAPFFVIPLFIAFVVIVFIVSIFVGGDYNELCNEVK